MGDKANQLKSILFPDTKDVLESAPEWHEIAGFPFIKNEINEIFGVT